MKVWRAAESGQWLKKDIRYGCLFCLWYVLSPPVLISTKGLERLLQLCNFRVRPVAKTLIIKKKKKKNDTKIELKKGTKIDTTSVAYFTKICSVSIGL